MRTVWRPTLLYAAAHFAVDFGCAYTALAHGNGSAFGFLIYNFCAFALQMPLGLLADRLNRNRILAAGGGFLVAAMCCVPSFGLWGMILLGIGNSLFHLGGGLDVLNLSGGQAAPLGVFVSPGALGLYCGTLLGKASANPLPVVLLVALLSSAVLALCRPAELPDNMPLKMPTFSVFPIAAALFLVVILRSYGGMTAAFPWKAGLWSWIAVGAVVLGKTLGGFLADRLGLRLSSCLSLGAAALFFALSDNPWFGTAALLLFNMTMPITLFALSQAMPGCKGFSFGLLTFALFLGFLPVYLGSGTIGSEAMILIALLSAVLLIPCTGRVKP